ncbi:MAG: serine protease [Elusimicrobiales bacterium]|nr:serine protease [Elusimicrobiales bacterium]
MKLRVGILLLAVLLPAYPALTPRHAHVPADLRDAVADSAYSDLAAGSEAAAAPEAPAPLPDADYTKSIYGADDRLDYYAAPAEMRALADSVVSLWSSRWVRPSGAKASLFTVTLGSAHDLCPGERFAEQPVGAFCSGALVGEDIVMTAGHCVTDEAKCAETKFLFGFALKRAGESPASVPLSDVYGCKRIIKRDLTSGTLSLLFNNLVNGGPGPDYAFIQLDRKVTGHRPLSVDRGGKAAAGDPLFVIGHPVGLPLKVAGGARVRDVLPKYFFLADLDTFGGNSGSAVFNARTKQINGILVRGDKDFVPSPAGCNVAAVMPQNGGRGEAVTKMSAISKYLP